MRKRYEALVVVALLGVAAWSRLYRLASESIWLDEAITFHRASLPIPELIENSIERLHNPSYFLFMHYWLKLGDDEFMLRLPSAVLGVLIVAAAYALGRVVGGIATGVLTGALVIVAPLHLRYAQEARMYMPYVLGTTVALAGLLWLVREPQRASQWPLSRDAGQSTSRAAWLAVIVGTLLALYTHNTAVFFVAACQCVAAVIFVSNRGQRRAWLRNWVAANALVLVAWIPWLRSLMVQTQRISKRFWAKFPSGATISETLQDLYLLTDKTMLLAAAVAVAALLGLWANRRRSRVGLALLLLAVTPPLIILLVSLKRPMFIPRIMLWSTVPFFALAAFGLSSVRPRLLAAVASVTLVAFAGYSLNEQYYRVQRKPDWRRAMADLASTATDDSVVLAIGGREARQMRYYQGRKTDPVPEFRWKWCEPHKLDRLLREKKTAWFITRTDKPNNKAILSMMRSRGRKVGEQSYGKRLRIMEYRIHASARNWKPSG